MLLRGIRAGPGIIVGAVAKPQAAVVVRRGDRLPAGTVVELDLDARHRTVGLPADRVVLADVPRAWGHDRIKSTFNGKQPCLAGQRRIGKTRHADLAPRSDLVRHGPVRDHDDTALAGGAG